MPSDFDTLRLLSIDTFEKLQTIRDAVAATGLPCPDEVSQQLETGMFGLVQLEKVLAYIAENEAAAPSGASEAPSDTAEQIAMMRNWLASPDVPEADKDQIRTMLQAMEAEDT